MLKYLFKVVYNDDSVFYQTPKDISATDPKRSCFFDVRQEDVKTFSIKGNGQKYLVDLSDGHFEVNGISFFAHDEPVTRFRLIFFRKHRHHFNAQTLEETGHEITYRIGWQANNLKGENFQRILEFI